MRQSLLINFCHFCFTALRNCKSDLPRAPSFPQFASHASQRMPRRRRWIRHLFPLPSRLCIDEIQLSSVRTSRGALVRYLSPPPKYTVDFLTVPCHHPPHRAVAAAVLNIFHDILKDCTFSESEEDKMQVEGAQGNCARAVLHTYGTALPHPLPCHFLLVVFSVDPLGHRLLLAIMREAPVQTLRMLFLIIERGSER